jgi:hypothetical protein
VCGSPQHTKLNSAIKALQPEGNAAAGNSLIGLHGGSSSPRPFPVGGDDTSPPLTPGIAIATATSATDFCNDKDELVIMKRKGQNKQVMNHSKYLFFLILSMVFLIFNFMFINLFLPTLPHQKKTPSSTALFYSGYKNLITIVRFCSLRVIRDSGM